jgi:hypothetical protein
LEFEILYLLENEGNIYTIEQPVDWFNLKLEIFQITLLILLIYLKKDLVYVKTLSKILRNKRVKILKFGQKQRFLSFVSISQPVVPDV